MTSEINVRKRGFNNIVSVFLILNLMIFMALGCSFNFGESSDNGSTVAEKENSSDSGDKEDKKSDKKNKDDDEDEENDEEKDNKDEVAEKTPPPTPKKVAPPTGAVVGFCNANNVVLRASPSLNGRKVGGLSNKQRLYIIEYSDTYDEWKGTTANWAYIQTESGAKGWVFTPFVSY